MNYLYSSMKQIFNIFYLERYSLIFCPKIFSYRYLKLTFIPPSLPFLGNNFLQISAQSLVPQPLHLFSRGCLCGVVAPGINFDLISHKYNILSVFNLRIIFFTPSTLGLNTSSKTPPQRGRNQGGSLRCGSRGLRSP